MPPEFKETKRSDVGGRAALDHERLRLDTLKFDWSKLPGVAQRALLWDLGYAINVNNDAVQMWTLGDNTMSLLVITLNKYEDAGLTKNFTQPDNSTLIESWHCKGAQMNKTTKCVVQEFDDSLEYNTAVWGVSGNPEGTPRCTCPSPIRPTHVDIPIL
ncbi:unnamed protein product [Phytophthora fragariaefolia]|uniref:Unnamed protein product n=1 Tax=Phytophthora fragariaefolia TaxID=1490495 RepID=A0A9W6XA96_9STRA|nr:unnamed protein product [Phytophthora fragariaefolia]